MRLDFSRFGVVAVLSFFLSPANAQWAVFDQEVKNILEKINKVTNIGDKKLQDFDQQSLFSEDFPSISVNNSERYVTSVADCGDKKLNENHFKACMGLRNLQLKTLDQTEVIVVRIRDRRTKMKQLIDAAHGGRSIKEFDQLQ